MRWANSDGAAIKQPDLNDQSNGMRTLCVDSNASMHWLRMDTASPFLESRADGDHYGVICCHSYKRAIPQTAATPQPAEQSPGQCSSAIASIFATKSEPVYSFQ